MAIEMEGGIASISDQASRLQTSLLQIADQVLATEAISDRLPLLSDSTPIFSQLRAVSRAAHDQSRSGKRKVADARSDVDDRSLALQNLKYQKRHLEEEIRMCRDFRSIYQEIALTEVDDFKARAPEVDKSAEILSDPHLLQLARLRFELSERKRLEAEKQSIQAERGSLIKENKEKKQRLEELERNLKEMLSKSDAITQHFEPAAKEEGDTTAVPAVE